MTTLYGINSINLPHIDLYRWAAEKKIFIPLDVKKIPDKEQLFLKALAMRQYFVKLPPVEEATRYSEALKEAAQHLSSTGLSDKAFIIIQVAGTAFLAIISLVSINTLAKL